MSIRKARILFFTLLISLTGFLGFIPGYNGDMPFYIAAAMNFEGKTDQESLSGAREIVRTQLNGEKSKFLVDNLDRAAPGILDFYRIKPAYIYLIIIFHRLGFSYILATTLPSLISFFLIGCVVFNWSSKRFKPLIAAITSSIFILMSPVVVLARLSTPDALSNLFIFICFYRIYFGKRYEWTILLLMASLLIRMDNLIAVGIILTLMYFWPQKEEKTTVPLLPFILSLLLTGIICIWMNFHYTSDFWWFRKIGYVQSFRIYRHELLLYFFSFSGSLIPVLVLMSCFAWLYRSSGIAKSILYMMTAIALIIFVRFLFFPSLQDRFMTAIYLCGFLLILDIFNMEKIEKKASIPSDNISRSGN